MNVLGFEVVRAEPMTGDTASKAVCGWDWLVDGVSVRKLWSSPEHPYLTEATSQVERIESLDRLAGRTTEPPNVVRGYSRTPLDVALGRQGTPWAPSGPAFEDGRVCLAVCPCGDLDCGALSTKVVLEGSVVRWQDVGWQVTYDPFDRSEQEVFSVVFDREQYLETIETVRELIAASV